MSVFAHRGLGRHAPPGHVSPAYVRFALLALADVVGARDVHNTYVDDDSGDESEEDGPASDDEGNPNDVAGSSPGKEGAATRPVGSHPPARVRRGRPG